MTKRKTKRNTQPDLCEDCQLIHELIHAPIGKVVPTLGLAKTQKIMLASARWALAPGAHLDPQFRSDGLVALASLAGEVGARGLV